MTREELLYAANEHVVNKRRMTDIAKELYTDRTNLYKQLKKMGIDYKNNHVYKCNNKFIEEKAV